MRNSATILWVLGALLCTSVGAEEGGSKFRLSIRPTGGASYTVLQFIKTTVPPDHSRMEDSTRLSGSFLHMVDGEVGLRVGLLERLSMQVGFNAHIWHHFKTYIEPLGRALSSGVTELRADAVLGDIENPPVTITAGYFNFQYAAQSQDLGEYLLSAGVHPGFLQSKKLSTGGRYGADLLGVHVRWTGIEGLILDGLLTTETFIVPNFDYSLTAIGHYTFGEVFTIGAGIMGNRLISLKEENTTPEKYFNQIQPSSVSVKDTVYDTMYTHRGGKVMLRLVFDPKPLFSSARFGEQDLVLYGEAALLGFKNYHYYYEDITERIPLMVGLHLPAFKVLDVLAAEVEWYGSPHKNDPENKGYPFPQYPYEIGDRDDIKWSLCAQKTLLKGFSVSGRVASDHLRIPDGGGWYESPYERFQSPDEWYWMLEFLFKF